MGKAPVQGAGWKSHFLGPRRRLFCFDQAPGAPAHPLLPTYQHLGHMVQAHGPSLCLPQDLCTAPLPPLPPSLPVVPPQRPSLSPHPEQLRRLSPLACASVPGLLSLGRWRQEGGREGGGTPGPILGAATVQGGPGLPSRVGLLESRVSPVQHFRWTDGLTDALCPLLCPRVRAELAALKAGSSGSSLPPKPPNFLLCLLLSLKLGNQQGRR